MHSEWFRLFPANSRDQSQMIASVNDQLMNANSNWIVIVSQTGLNRIAFFVLLSVFFFLMGMKFHAKKMCREFSVCVFFFFVGFRRQTHHQQNYHQWKFDNRVRLHNVFSRNMNEYACIYWLLFFFAVVKTALPIHRIQMQHAIYTTHSCIADEWRKKEVKENFAIRKQHLSFQNLLFRKWKMYNKHMNTHDDDDESKKIKL